MYPAPIVLFVYNRPWHTQQTVEALKKNDLAETSDLFIFSDAPKNGIDENAVSKVRHYVERIRGFKSVSCLERKNNWGLAENVIDGISLVINKFGKVIVLEDDLLTSRYFLNFMNSSLSLYSTEPIIFSISGYNLPPSLMKIPSYYKFDVYFNYRNSSQGWATWHDRWQKADWGVADFDEFMKSRRQRKLFNRGGDDLSGMLIAQKEGRIDSWSIRWSYTHFKHQALALYPIKSYIHNIGFDGSGVHRDKSQMFDNDVSRAKKEVVFPHSVSIDDIMMSAFTKAYRISLLNRAVSMTKKIFNRARQ